MVAKSLAIMSVTSTAAFESVGLGKARLKGALNAAEYSHQGEDNHRKQDQDDKDLDEGES